MTGENFCHFSHTLTTSVGTRKRRLRFSGRETGFLRRSVTLRSTAIDFRVYIPEVTTRTKKYPVILYLHGRGARGNDNERQIGVAHLGSVIQLFDMKYPERYRSFIAVFPQTQSSWSGDLRKTLSKHSIKPSRNLTATRKEFIWRDCL